MRIFLLFLFSLTIATAETRTLVLNGTVTNTTGEITAPARLEIVQDGEKLTAKLVTMPPLTGTGSMAGRWSDGWCELDGSLDGGFTVKFRGVFNERDFRGTYTAKPTQGPVQYGRFQLSLRSPAEPE